MGMEFPLISSLLSGRQAETFPNVIKDFEKAIADKHIWNTDYESGKSFLSNRCDEAVDKMKAIQRTAHDRPQWESNDIRWYTVYTPSFLNYPGAVKKLQKFKDDPYVAGLLPIFTEVAKVAEIVKAVKPFIEKGRKPNPNAKPVDLTNTGTCAICQKLQKLSGKGKMVHHGYQISDGYGHYFGFRSGSCFGVDRTPYELSCEANKEYVAALTVNLNKVKERLQDLESGKVTEIVRLESSRSGSFGQRKQEAVTYKQGDEKWKVVLDGEIREVKGAIGAIEYEIEQQGWLIKDWKKKELPYGTK